MKFNQLRCSLLHKTVLDKPLYKLSAGRSMVEMLGVLAIIGVLSVGAIAGYSKAMMKYKLNKQAEQIGWLLNIMYQYKSQWIFPTNQFTQVAPYYKKLNLISDEMIKDNTDYIYDVFNTKIEIRTNDCSDKCKTIILYYRLGNNKTNTIDICSNIIQTGLNFREELQRFGIKRNKEDDSQTHIYWGNKFCNSSTACMKDISFNELSDLCGYCDSKDSCDIYFTYTID